MVMLTCDVVVMLTCDVVVMLTCDMVVMVTWDVLKGYRHGYRYPVMYRGIDMVTSDVLGYRRGGSHGNVAVMVMCDVQVTCDVVAMVTCDVQGYTIHMVVVMVTCDVQGHR